jgi:hypothetical protein
MLNLGANREANILTVVSIFIASACHAVAYNYLGFQVLVVQFPPPFQKSGRTLGPPQASLDWAMD